MHFVRLASCPSMLYAQHVYLHNSTYKYVHYVTHAYTYVYRKSVVGVWEPHGHTLLVAVL